MQAFQLIVWLTVVGKLSLVPSVFTGPGSVSFLKTMTSSLVTQVLLLYARYLVVLPTQLEAVCTYCPQP